MRNHERGYDTDESNDEQILCRNIIVLGTKKNNYSESLVSTEIGDVSIDANNESREGNENYRTKRC